MNTSGSGDLSSGMMMMMATEMMPEEANASYRCYLPPTFPPSVNIPESINYIQACIALLLGTVGFSLNLFILIMIATYKSLHQRLMYLALHIVLINLLYTLTIPPVIFTSGVSGHWLLGTALCNILGMVQDFFTIFRFTMTLILTLDRFISIFWPFFYIMNSLKIVLVLLVLVWLVSIVRVVLPLPGLFNCFLYVPTQKTCTAFSGCSVNCFYFVVASSLIIVSFGIILPSILYVILFCKTRSVRKQSKIVIGSTVMARSTFVPPIGVSSEFLNRKHSYKQTGEAAALYKGGSPSAGSSEGEKMRAVRARSSSLHSVSKVGLDFSHIPSTTIAATTTTTLGPAVPGDTDSPVIQKFDTHSVCMDSHMTADDLSSTGLFHGAALSQEHESSGVAMGSSNCRPCPLTPSLDRISPPCDDTNSREPNEAEEGGSGMGIEIRHHKLSNTKTGKVQFCSTLSPEANEHYLADVETDLDFVRQEKLSTPSCSVSPRSPDIKTEDEEKRVFGDLIRPDLLHSPVSINVVSPTPVNLSPRASTTNSDSVARLEFESSKHGSWLQQPSEMTIFPTNTRPLHDHAAVSARSKLHSGSLHDNTAPTRSRFHSSNLRVTVTMFVLLMSVIGCTLPAWTLYGIQFLYLEPEPVLFIVNMMVGWTFFNLIPTVDSIAIMRHQEFRLAIRDLLKLLRRKLRL